METVDTYNLSDLTKCRLNEIVQVEDYFNLEIQQEKNE